jgi:hypothetical protein
MARLRSSRFSASRRVVRRAAPASAALLFAGQQHSSTADSAVTNPVTMPAYPSLYVALRDGGFRKFLTGAFFVSSGIFFILADVSVPLLGISFVETPQISGGCSAVHFILFLLCYYFDFVSKKV